MAITLTFLDFERVQIPYPLLDKRDLDECMTMDAPSKINELMADRRATIPSAAEDTDHHILSRSTDDGDCVEFISVRMMHLDHGDYGDQSIYQTDDPFVYQLNGCQYDRIDNFTEIMDVMDRLLSQAAAITLMDRLNAGDVRHLKIVDDSSELWLNHLTSKDQIKISYEMMDGTKEKPPLDDLRLFQSLWNHFQIKMLFPSNGTTSKLSQVSQALAEHAVINIDVLESIIDKTLGAKWLAQYTERQLINMVIPHHVVRI